LGGYLAAAIGGFFGHHHKLFRGIARFFQAKLVGPRPFLEHSLLVYALRQSLPGTIVQPVFHTDQPLGFSVFVEDV